MAILMGYLAVIIQQFDHLLADDTSPRPASFPRHASCPRLPLCPILALARYFPELTTLAQRQLDVSGLICLAARGLVGLVFLCFL